MTTTETPTIETTVDAYFAMWNEDDRAARLQVIAQAWTSDCRYVDPLGDHSGHEGVADMVQGVRGHYPGATLRRTTDLDTHHDVVRFGWEAVGADGAVIVGGIDVGQIDPDGRLRSITGFFG
jgi:hypothetical protein